MRPVLAIACRLVPALAGLAVLASSIACGPVADQRTVHAAVASNFAVLHDELAHSFEAQSGYRVRSSYASTGKLYAQIRAGAPFDVLLAADAERPRLLEDEGRAVRGSRFVYATGRLALFAPGREIAARGLDALRGDDFRHLAMADPDLAPYGAAAREVLIGAGLWTALQARVVRGENVAQALHFVASGAAEFGFVALAEVGTRPSQEVWIVPDSLHAAITQEAVLLASAVEPAGALAYLEFLASDAARARMAQSGYGPTK